MWVYEKKLEYPVKIKQCNPRLAKVIITQYGGPNGELGAALRYLSQRFTMVTPQARATLNDIGISSPEMFQYEKILDKLHGKKILLHTISTKDRVAKWDGSTPEPIDIFPYKITSYETKRVVRLYAAV